MIFHLTWIHTYDAIKIDFKLMINLYGQTTFTRFITYMARIMSLFFLGRRVSNEKFAAVSLANSIMNVLGQIVIMSFVSGLNTIAGQFYGAADYDNVGYALQCALFAVTFITIPISIVYAFGESTLLLLGQEALVSKDAGVSALNQIRFCYMKSFYRDSLKSLYDNLLLTLQTYLWILIPTTLLFGFRQCIQNFGMVGYKCSDLQ